MRKPPSGILYIGAGAVAATVAVVVLTRKSAAAIPATTPAQALPASAEPAAGSTAAQGPAPVQPQPKPAPLVTSNSPAPPPTAMTAPVLQPGNGTTGTGVGGALLGAAAAVLADFLGNRNNNGTGLPTPPSAPAPTPGVGPGTPTPPGHIDGAQYYDGQLIQSVDDNYIYLVQGGKKHWITDMNAFDAGGFKLADVHRVSPDIIVTIPAGLFWGTPGWDSP